MSTWFQIVIAGLALIISATLSYLSYRKGKAELFYKLFTAYNDKYRVLNHKLYLILEKEKSLGEKIITKDDFTRDEISTVMDYLNLCSEEYLWKKKGFIDRNVWESWQNGIQWWYDNSALIRVIWKEEFSQWKSYYIDGDKSFIKLK